jgi:predicted MFS family arabinose efflux permease
MPTPVTQSRRRGGLLRQADFRALWIGETSSRLGSAVTSVVLPLIAVTTLNADSFVVGALSTASSLPWLLVSLPAGVWVDRVRRRPLMIGCDLVAVAALATVPLTWALGLLSLAQLLVVAFTVGTTTVLFVTAYRAYVPFIVGSGHLVEANAKIQGSEQASQISGRVLGGVLAQLLGPATALLVDAAGYLASAFCLTRVRAREPRPPAHPGRAGLIRQLVEGLRFTASDPHLRFLSLFSATANLAFTTVQALQIVFLIRDVGLTAGQVGFAVAATGSGGVAGAIAATRTASRWGSARAVRLWALSTAPLAALIPLTSPGPGIALFMAGTFATGAGLVAITVIVVAFRQAHCPPELLGRVSASVQFLNYGAVPLGTLIAGALADSFGNRTALWCGAFLFAIYGLMPLLSPLTRARDFPHDQKST